MGLDTGAKYYPIILNGAIVSIYEMFEDIDSQKLHFQAAPYFVNELNALMNITSAENPLILGYTNNNLIGIIGNYTVVNVMESLCAELVVNVGD